MSSNSANTSSPDSQMPPPPIFVLALQYRIRNNFSTLLRSQPEVSIETLNRRVVRDRIPSEPNPTHSLRRRNNGAILPALWRNFRNSCKDCSVRVEKKWQNRVNSSYGVWNECVISVLEWISTGDRLPVSRAFSGSRPATAYSVCYDSIECGNFCLRYTDSCGSSSEGISDHVGQT